MATRRSRTTPKQAVLRLVEDLLDVSEIAKNVEITFVIGKDSPPTVSYKIDELPLFFDPSAEKLDN